jgi:hypothetical protein
VRVTFKTSFVDLEREDVFLAQTALQKDFLRPYSQYFSIGSYKSFAPLSHFSISAAFNDIVELFGYAFCIMTRPLL